MEFEINNQKLFRSQHLPKQQFHQTYRLLAIGKDHLHQYQNNW